MLFGITFCVVSHDPAHSCPTGPRIPLGPPSSNRLDTTDGQKANSCNRDSPEKLTKEQRLARLARGPYEGVPRRRRGAAVRAAEAPLKSTRVRDRDAGALCRAFGHPFSVDPGARPRGGGHVAISDRMVSGTRGAGDTPWPRSAIAWPCVSLLSHPRVGGAKITAQSRVHLENID